MRWLLAFLLVCTPALAHDHLHPELNKWYGALRNGMNIPCCDDSEAIHLRDLDWESQNKPDSHFRVRVPISPDSEVVEWIDVPDGAVINQPNLDGSTLVWPLYGYMGVSIRCFMMGAQG